MKSCDFIYAIQKVRAQWDGEWTSADVYVFPQVFSDSSFGKGGLAMQNFCRACMIVVVFLGEAKIYVNGDLRLHVARLNERFFEDLANHRMLGVIAGNEQRYDVND